MEGRGENGKWKMENERGMVESGEWKVERGVWVGCFS